ncbi:dihydrofolate reductase [Sporolactobacillus shoreae]|uniref:Dihydrofolate reductase n=1 Tax=Sporolactobacillus shoreae TaxID=1465501 RepID=A0A4Z0GVW0_9BACL|nr:dihydrofolate reductase [Sporolactobacillus shoreae]TGB00426.1 dihydrofolate reductase [Sporolactobacillus shoreae]
MISFMLAMDQNALIGRDNSLPWHLPDDLHYFKKKTVGHSVIMGRKTFDSMGKPLSGRHNIVLTRNPDFAPEGVSVCHSVEELLSSGLTYGKECFVIGGAHVFSALITYADRLYITKIDAEFEGDTYFESFEDREWHLVSSTLGLLDKKNIFPHSFLIYERD